VDQPSLEVIQVLNHDERYENECLRPKV